MTNVSLESGLPQTVDECKDFYNLKITVHYGRILEVAIQTSRLEGSFLCSSIPPHQIRMIKAFILNPYALNLIPRGAPFGLPNDEFSYRKP